MKAKRIIAFSIMAGVITALVIVMKKAAKKENFKKEVSERTHTLPFMTFRDIHGNIFTNKDLGTNRYSIIIHFSPDCEHCQYEAKEIKKNIALFHDADIIMISSADSIAVARFTSQYELNNLSNVFMMADKKNQFYQLFGTAGVPAIFIYDRQHKLLEKIMGEIKIEAITKYFRQQ